MLNEDFNLGFVYGVAAALIPGPMMALIVAQATRGSFKGALKMAVFSPLFSSLPIMFVSVCALQSIKDSWALPVLSAFGGLFLIYLAITMLLTSRTVIENPGSEGNSILKGALINFLSPYPYISWATVGGPIIVSRLGEGTWPVISFPVAYFVSLMFCQAATAYSGAKAASFLSSKTRLLLLRVLGLCLLFFGFKLVLAFWNLSPHAGGS